VTLSATTALLVIDVQRTGPEGEHHSAEQMHRLALASLHEEFATVRRTGGEVLAEAGLPG